MRYTWFLLVSLVTAASVFGQAANRRDSLKALITQTRNLPDKVDVLNQLTYELANKDYKQALEYGWQALKLADSINYQQGLADAHSRLGVVDYYLTDYESSLTHYLQSMQINDSLNREAQLARDFNNIAMVYKELKSYQKALEYYYHAYEIFFYLGQDAYAMGMIQNNMGIVYRNLANKFPQKEKMYQDSALHYYEESLKHARYNNLKQLKAYLLNNIGLVLFDQGQYLPAKEHMISALRLNEQLGNRFEVLNVSISLTNLLIASGDLAKAKNYLKRAGGLLQEVNSMRLSLTYYKAQQAYYIETKQLTRAIQSANHYIQLSEDLYSEERMNIVSRAQVKLEIEKEQSRNRLLKQKLDLQEKLIQDRNRALWIFGFMFILMLGLLVGLAIALKTNKRNVRELELKSLKVKAQNKELLYQQEEITSQRDEIEATNRELEIQNTNMYSSIEAASLLQTAVLPKPEFINEHLDEYFILYRPQSIVSGDFYWMDQIDDKLIVIVADCTGHGVTGALVATIGYTILNRIVRQKHETDPKTILQQLDAAIMKLLNNERNEHYGMDVSVLLLEKGENEHFLGTYAGAKRPLYYMLPGEEEMNVLKGARKSIGTSYDTAFFNTEIHLPPDTVAYMFSDGFADQLAENEKRLGSKNFRRILETYARLPMRDQRLLIEKRLNQMLAGNDQRDDILLMGIRF